MKNTLLFVLLCLFCFTNLVAQDEVVAEEKEKDKPVRFAWESGLLIDNQTSNIPTVKTLEFVIQHKFGTVENGHSNLWGIYAPAANVRLGLNYVVARNIQVGWGISKRKMYNDVNAKWTIFEQTRQNQIPVFVTVYANAAIDGRPDEDFGLEYKFSDRYSYFSELIVGRKVTEALSLQAGASFSHANSVAEKFDHDRVGLHFNGRMKVSPQGSIIFNYDLPLEIEAISEQRPEWNNHPKPNLSFGYEVSTSTHAFQIYMGNSEGMLLQDIMMNNFNKIEKDNFAIGFTITRLWSF
jgi:hypothetical protein